MTETDLARDIALGADGFDVHLEERGGVRTLRALFDGGFDAARAAIDMVVALDDGTDGASAPRAEGDDARRWGMRIVLCTAGEGPAGPARAAQLLARAARGQILMAAATAILVGATLPRDADLLYHGVWTPDRDKPPERVYELCLAREDDDSDAPSNLQWARRAAEAVEADSAGTAPHRRDLLRIWRHSAAGHLRMALVHGGSGAARTAIGADLALRAHAAGALVLYGRWDRQHPDEYGALREAFGSYAGGCAVERLRSYLDGHVEEIVRLLPEVGARIGVARSGPPVEVAWPWDSAASRIDEALGTWLSRIAARRPTLLVLDELQWADPASVQVLAHLWHACVQRPVTVLMTTSGEGDASGSIAERLAGSATSAGSTAIDRIHL
ncbi:AAA family ATPase [Dactylosporangium sp. CA-052675]|uniref:AAA family ATPase n=1 Tax=Dactylosporangium sp. CA-052675 TaxID=3239927 RepID=UPI003D8D0D91